MLVYGFFYPCRMTRGGEGETVDSSAATHTFDVEERYHITELLDMLRQVRLLRDVLQAAEALLREAGGDPRELVADADGGEPLAHQAEVGNILRPIWHRLR